MLTPHEMATLMLIGGAAPNLTQLDRADIEALIARQLVHWETMDASRGRPCITREGSSVLNAICGCDAGRSA